ncbi:MAG: DUF3656 domain-containing protein [Eubacteriales bacterium]|nr:DUF3656 domain-containing protein [Eubacteriales bacterium]
MLELLSPAGSPESVIAAVQNGADAVYLGFGDYNARRGAKNFTLDEFEKAVRYCRVRGCKVYVTLNTLVNDREIENAVRCARAAAKFGASGIIIQDLGLVRILRESVPDIPLHASTQMSIHNLAGAEAAAQMGIKRVVLARELNFEQIKFITQNASVETEIFVHGALCFCHSGQCYMSSLIGRRSGNRGMCAQPCRMQYSLGGRLDDYPLSLKDNCLVDRLQEIEEAGVACVKIEGRMKRPEYTAIVTDIYSRAIREHRQPGPEEMRMLEDAFSRNGFTQGYFNGEKSDMFGVRGEPSSDIDKLFAATRKSYAEGEMRRVPVHFYTVVEKDKNITAIAFDDDGNKAIAKGPVPEKANRQGLTDTYIVEQMYKTGGTPFNCVENKAKTEPGLYVSASEINELRRTLINDLTEKRGNAPEVRSIKIPAMPKNIAAIKDPCLIFQVRTDDQLSEELADLKPAYLYAPAELMRNKFELLKPFTENGTVPVAIVPRVVADDQVQDVTDILKDLRDKGIEEALVGNLGHVFLAKSAGMKLRGDFGLNAFNSYSLEVLENAGFLSATASFELRLAQIKDLAKPLNTELIVYGRLPLMVSDQCVISRSSGRCSCQTPGQLADRMGSVFPVVKEYGCRNVIYNAHKLYLADKREDLNDAGLWGLRLLFSTESGREAAEVARCYMGISDYKPNVLTRGLYYRGVD